MYYVKNQALTFVLMIFASYFSYKLSCYLGCRDKFVLMEGMEASIVAGAITFVFFGAYWNMKFGPK